MLGTTEERVKLLKAGFVTVKNYYYLFDSFDKTWKSVKLETDFIKLV
jgi:hypothetical protein